jgi:GntR family transcriptional regulator
VSDPRIVSAARPGPGTLAAAADPPFPPGFSVSRSRPEPLRHQIRRAIAEQVASGELAPGDRLPTEREYADRFGLSLAPVRQALLDLVATGQLYRVKGRGTFVREPGLEEEITLLLGFTDTLRHLGVPFEIRVLEQGLVPAPVAAARALDVPVGTLVVLLRRLALVRGEPAAVLEACLPADRFGPLAASGRFEDGQSLYRRLEEEFGVQLRGTSGTLQVVHCDDVQAALLDVPVGTAALLVRSLATDTSGLPVEAAKVLYRADRFVFHIERPRVRP